MTRSGTFEFADPEKMMTTLSRFLRSVGAILAGLIAVIVLSTATDAVLHSSGIFPPLGTPMSDLQFALALGYRSIFAIAGCYIAARLAPSRPMRHALILGAIGFVLSLIGTIATWNGGPEFARKWYPIALVVTSIPCGWLGGKIQQITSSR
jgi:MFS-type transporter involved in bile tolerance (Atg22 family)